VISSLDQWNAAREAHRAMRDWKLAYAEELPRTN